MKKSLEYMAIALLLLYPSLLFIFRGGMNGSMFSLAIVCILLLFTRTLPSLTNAERAFGVSMASGIFIILVVQIYHNDIEGKYFDSAARFLLAAPILLALRNVDSLKIYKVLQYAFPLGAITALSVIIISRPLLDRPVLITFINHIHLGDLSILLGFLSVLGINWLDKDSKIVVAIKLLGGIAGLLVAALTWARGSWLAIPAFIAIYVYKTPYKGYWKRMGIAYALTIVMVALLYSSVGIIHDRISMAYSNLSQFGMGNVDSSIGVRFQLWKVAVDLIFQNPIFGVGADGFRQAMDVLNEKGIITDVAAEFGRGEVHNEILAQTTRFGIGGVLFILSIYFVPMYYFVYATKSVHASQKIAALMGVAVTLGFFVFGLTVETFNIKMMAAFYSTTVTVLFSACCRDVR